MTIRFDLLATLADFLETVPEENFNFNIYVGFPEHINTTPSPLEPFDCGTVGCAIGWLPKAFPGKFHWNPHDNWVWEVLLSSDPNQDDFRAAQAFFGLSSRQVHALFSPLHADGYGNGDCDGDATPKQVAAHIRLFIEVEGDLDAFEVAA